MSADTRQLASSFVNGLDAGRFQGYQDGREGGYRDGYAAGHADGALAAWRAAEADERRRFAIAPGRDIGPSFAELQKRRNDYGPAKPLKTPAECLATWGQP
ncbi:hypothetical protein [Promicromonospora soli]